MKNDSFGRWGPNVGYSHYDLIGRPMTTNDGGDEGEMVYLVPVARISEVDSKNDIL